MLRCGQRKVSKKTSFKYVVICPMFFEKDDSLFSYIELGFDMHT